MLGGLASKLIVYFALAGSLRGLGALPEATFIQSYSAYLSGECPLRIGLATNAPSVKIACGSPADVIETGGGGSLAKCLAGETLAFYPVLKKHLIKVERGRSGDAFTCQGAIIKPQDQEYGTTVVAGSKKGCFQGNIQVSLGSAGRLTVINLIALEDYLEGVVGAEMPSRFHPEALKAQAVAARTYALSRLSKHEEEGFDLCSTVLSQVYLGKKAGHPKVIRAVRETAGQVLTYRGFLMRPAYHSTCGGMTEDSYRMWWGEILPYISARSDQPHRLPLPDETAVRRFLSHGSTGYCQGSPRYRWQEIFTRKQVVMLVRRNLSRVMGYSVGNMGAFKNIRVAARTPAGRAQSLEVITTQGSYLVQGDRIRWLFGNGNPGPHGLKSTFFVLDYQLDPASQVAAKFIFTGAGHGHGLGMCQWGAEGRAQAGASYREILSAYYLGAHIHTFPGNSAAQR